ncbi:uncharacterized protein LOC120839654 [Ixodes scapularis]|uniref:uncharacterized protein LOC120839654 n=1 Tax=Ixodes scapularis TaxID=6945 RepID=UPI001A9F7009|nr:uncharacterized protein LOC120839654 [Ixodes scapularis]
MCMGARLSLLTCTPNGTTNFLSAIKRRSHNWPKDQWSSVTLKTIVVAEADLLLKIYQGPFFDDPITYLILVMASVGLRLSALEHPGIQLKLTGVYSAPKKVEDLMRKKNPEKLPVKRASRLMSSNMKSGSPHQSSDVVLFLTQ